MQTANKRVAIFGGSFDPVHLGHLGMLQSAMKEAALDEVIMMPCFVSPFKEGTEATGEQRVRMIELAISDLDLEGVSVSRYEIEREGPSYSWETATEFAKTFPGTDWYWILGTDQWNSIDLWARPDLLQSLLRFLVVTRSRDSVMDREGWQFFPVSFSHPASSTLIRREFQAHLDWITPSVRDFCRTEGLYESGR